MRTMDIGAMVFQGIIFLLVILFFVSLILFVRRILTNQATKAQNSVEIEKKLDKIIELLEQDKSKK